MNAKKLEKQLIFKTKDIGHSIIISGEITLSAECEISKYSYIRDKDELIEVVKKRISQTIVNRLYKDKRSQLYKAIDELVLKCRGYGSDIDEAREKLISAAKEQEPEDI